MQRGGVQQAAGVVDQHVDAPERRERGLHGALNVGLVGDTARHGERVTAGRGDLISDRIERFFAAARDRHSRSFTCERSGDGGADAGSGARHDGYFVRESHDRLLAQARIAERAWGSCVVDADGWCTDRHATIVW